MGQTPSCGRRLLLVEDDRMVRDTIILMLEDEYDVLYAESVSTAMTLLRGPNAASFDVMLLDCLLPNGRVSDVLAVADERGIPVLLISGDPTQAEAIGPGRRFLPKPFTRTALLSVLDSARG